ncbi:MAG: UDP-2,4-diacetamido-2,4,6-trideoxy-beta-L-altropyranose hydrolase, partial [Planctomycetota bacterium]
MANDAKLLIRADSGPAVGTGHVMRMFALAEAWKQIGGRTFFVASVLPGTLRNRLETSGFEVEEIGPSHAGTTGIDAQRTFEIADHIGADWIAADGYVFDDRWEEVVSGSNRKLLVMDDFAHSTHHRADLVVNQNAYATAELYPRKKPKQLLLGCRYLLMRPEFAPDRCRARAVPNNEPRRILVTLGGADPDNVTSKVIRCLEAIQIPDLEIDVVVGPDFKQRRMLVRQAAQSKHSVTLHSNVRNMGELMLQADFALSAGGTTTYELARCGVPTVVISIADNQIEVAKELQRLRVAKYAGHFESLHDKVLIDLISHTMLDYKERIRMSRNGRALVDGKGAGRIAGRMINSLFDLRPATIEDASMILDWRNEPETRAVSFHREAIDLECHTRWMKGKLADPDCRIWIVVDKSNQPVGQVRIEKSEQQGPGLQGTGMISVSIRHEFRGRGLGPLLIRKAALRGVEELSITRVVAQIKPFNSASKHAFAK